MRYFFNILIALLLPLFVVGNSSPTAMPTGQATAEKKQQDQKPGEEVINIKVNVDLVTTDVTVIGNSVSELRAEDFLIYDDYVAQEISYFSRDQLPIAVAILVDSSGSIEEHLSELKIGALTALRHLKPEDQVALYAFAGDFKRLSNLTEDRLHIAKLINTLVGQSGTNIYDTLYDAAAYLKNEDYNRRRVIILISDNCHLEGRIRSDLARIELLETGTILYNIVMPSEHTQLPFCLESNPFIKAVAVETGGDVMDVVGPRSLKGALEKTISNLRTQYTLGFNPSNPGAPKSFHRLAVRFADKSRCPDCQIIGRNGYYKGVSAPLPSPQKESKLPLQSLQQMDMELVQQIILTAATAPHMLNEIPLKVSMTEKTDSDGEAQLKIDLQIDPARIDFPTSDSRHNYKLIAAVIYSDKNGKILANDIKKIDYHPNEEDYKRIIKHGIPYSTTIPIKTEKQIVRIVIFDEKSDKIGTIFIQLH